jgi:hypothetical protein
VIPQPAPARGLPGLFQLLPQVPEDVERDDQVDLTRALADVGDADVPEPLPGAGRRPPMPSVRMRSVVSSEAPLALSAASSAAGTSSVLTQSPNFGPSRVLVFSQ